MDRYKLRKLEYNYWNNYTRDRGDMLIRSAMDYIDTLEAKNKYLKSLHGKFGLFANAVWFANGAMSALVIYLILK